MNCSRVDSMERSPERRLWRNRGYRLTLLACLGLAGCSQAPGNGPAPPPPAVKVAAPLERPVTDYADFTGRTMAVDSVRVRRGCGAIWRRSTSPRAATSRRAMCCSSSINAPTRPPWRGRKPRWRRARPTSGACPGDQMRGELLLRIQRDQPRGTRKDRRRYSPKRRPTVKSAAASRDVAKLNLDFTEIKAPISGQISRAMVTVGNMVESGETGGTVLTTIMSTDTMYAYFDVDDQTWVQVRQALRKSSLRHAHRATRPHQREGLSPRGQARFRGQPGRCRHRHAADARPLSEQGSRC